MVKKVIENVFLRPPKTCLMDQRRMLKHEKHGNLRMNASMHTFSKWRFHFLLKLKLEAYALSRDDVFVSALQIYHVKFFPISKQTSLFYGASSSNVICIPSMVYCTQNLLYMPSSKISPVFQILSACTYIVALMQPTNCPTFDL